MIRYKGNITTILCVLKRFFNYYYLNLHVLIFIEQFKQMCQSIDFVFKIKETQKFFKAFTV